MDNKKNIYDSNIKAKWLSDAHHLPVQDFVTKYFGMFLVAVLIPFGIYDVIQGRYEIALADLCAIIIIVIDYICIQIYHRNLLPRTVLIFGLCLVIWYVTYKEGSIGIYWSYPFITSIYFFQPHRTAIVINVIYLLGMFPLVMRTVSDFEAYRVMMTLVLNGFVAFVFSFIVDKQRQSLAKQAITDVLTSAFNRRYLQARINELVMERNRYGHQLSLILIDIDNFKTINDKHGHEYGDKVLCDLVQTVRTRIRQTDQIFRQGGDEFVVLLPNTGITETKSIAEDILKLLVERDSEQKIPITLSCGIGEHSEGELIEAWLHRCDLAMYQAKQQGRNRIVLSILN